MYLNAENIEVKKTKISLTVSLRLSKYEEPTNKVTELLEMAIQNGASANILRQVLNGDGTLKIKNRHSFY